MVYNGKVAEFQRFRVTNPEDGEGLGLAFGYSIIKFTKYS